jgi:hypothetical protein
MTKWVGGKYNLALITILKVMVLSLVVLEMDQQRVQHAQVSGEMELMSWILSHMIVNIA